MIQTELISEATSLKARHGESATGNIWLKLDGYHFPGSGWNDFMVVLMGWWANALLRQVRGLSTQEIIPFMDGPYAVEVTMVSPGVLRFRALQGENRNTEVAAGEGSAEAFIDSLTLQGREVLDACRRQSWWSKDADVLESALQALTKGSSPKNDFG